MVDEEKEEENEDKDKIIKKEHNLLYQLKDMFSQLILSDRQDYNPTNFCKAFKDFEGNSVNIAIQQDALEFMNVFFDKIENCLK